MGWLQQLCWPADLHVHIRAKKIKPANLLCWFISHLIDKSTWTRLFIFPIFHIFLFIFLLSLCLLCDGWQKYSTYLICDLFQEQSTSNIRSSKDSLSPSASDFFCPSCASLTTAGINNTSLQWAKTGKLPDRLSFVIFVPRNMISWQILIRVNHLHLVYY